MVFDELLQFGLKFGITFRAMMKHHPDLNPVGMPPHVVECVAEIIVVHVGNATPQVVADLQQPGLRPVDRRRRFLVIFSSKHGPSF